MKVKNKLIILSMILIIISTSVVHATFNIKTADLYSKGRCKTLLKTSNNGLDIIVTKVFYKNNGKENPAYCINKELGGVGEYGNYSVSINDVVRNPLVWRIITNGYPYKSIQSLGLADEDEAYTATKQAVYCVLYDYDFSKFIPVGQAGERTLNAMKQIVTNARNSQSTKPNNNIQIKEITDWKVDETDQKYIIKNFEIFTECNYKDLKIEIVDNKENQIKISEIKDNKFSIKLPINLLEKDDEIEIKASAQLETNPVLYGNSNNSAYQNYAITGEIYEGGYGSKRVQYNKNTTHLKIIKKDDKDGKILKGVKFKILNDKGEIKYSNLETNDKGEIDIEGILPGKYYIEEVSTIYGYKLLENRIEFEIALNEELSITITNNKEEIIPKKEKSYSERITKLPVTGM